MPCRWSTTPSARTRTSFNILRARHNLATVDLVSGLSLGGEPLSGSGNRVSSRRRPSRESSEGCGTSSVIISGADWVLCSPRSAPMRLPKCWAPVWTAESASLSLGVDPMAARRASGEHRRQWSRPKPPIRSPTEAGGPPVKPSITLLERRPNTSWSRQNPGASPGRDTTQHRETLTHSWSPTRSLTVSFTV